GAARPPGDAFRSYCYSNSVECDGDSAATHHCAFTDTVLVALVAVPRFPMIEAPRRPLAPEFSAPTVDGGHYAQVSNRALRSHLGRSVDDADGRAAILADHQIVNR